MIIQDAIERLESMRHGKYWALSMTDRTAIGMVLKELSRLQSQIDEALNEKAKEA